MVSILLFHREDCYFAEGVKFGVIDGETGTGHLGVTWSNQINRNVPEAICENENETFVSVNDVCSALVEFFNYSFLNDNSDK